MNTPLPPRRRHPYQGQARLSPRAIQPSTGLGLTSNVLGFSVSTLAGGSQWAHPFRPALGGNSLVFNRGLVDVYEPTIEGKLISSGARLRLDPGTANEAGESYAALEFVPNKDGLVDAKTEIKIVHTAAGLSGDPQLARYHLALILWNSGQPVLVHDIAHFDVRYKRVTKASEVPAFHLFY